MTDTKELSFLDYIVLLVRWKRLFVLLGVGLFSISYLSIFLFIDNEYDASTTILPTGDREFSNVASLMKNLGNLPLGMGMSTKSADMDLYTTIINSRTTLEKIIFKFDLLKDYKQKSMEKAIELLRTKIRTRVTDENAYQVVIRASSAQKACDMANYILELLNTTVIELNVAKSRDNRVFLEQRYNEMVRNLRSAEDSLQYYQQKSGMLEAKEQTKLMITSYSTLEAGLISKQIELSILEKTLSHDSPQLVNLQVEVQEYEKKINQLRKIGDGNGVILALDSLPETAKHYVQHYRDVEIYSKIIEFLVPLFEQARFEEQRNVPVLQIIEYPVPPEKKSYPPRVLYGLALTLTGLIIAFFYIQLHENEKWQSSERVRFIRENITNWKKG